VCKRHIGGDPNLSQRPPTTLHLVSFQVSYVGIVSEIWEGHDGPKRVGRSRPSLHPSLIGSAMIPSPGYRGIDIHPSSQICICIIHQTEGQGFRSITCKFSQSYSSRNPVPKRCSSSDERKRTLKAQLFALKVRFRILSRWSSNFIPFLDLN